MFLRIFRWFDMLPQDLPSDWFSLPTMLLHMSMLIAVHYVVLLEPPEQSNATRQWSAASDKMSLHLWLIKTYDVSYIFATAPEILIRDANSNTFAPSTSGLVLCISPLFCEYSICTLQKLVFCACKTHTLCLKLLKTWYFLSISLLRRK